jgi:hypothetical protein
VLDHWRRWQQHLHRGSCRGGRERLEDEVGQSTPSARRCRSTPPRATGPEQKQPQEEGKREATGRPNARREGGST